MNAMRRRRRTCLIERCLPARGALWQSVAWCAIGVFATGCTQSAPEPEVARSLDAGTLARVIERQGRYSKVAVENGEEFFVLHERLQLFNEQGSETGPTHRLAASAEAFAKLPDVPRPGESQLPARSRDEIFQEQLGLPRLYLTTPSHKRIIASTHKGKFIDPESGEEAWPALACHRPDCPGRSKDGQLYVFIEADTGLVECPKCLTDRDRENETTEQRQPYINWIKPHVLPETARRMAELSEERQRLRRSPR